MSPFSSKDLPRPSNVSRESSKKSVPPSRPHSTNPSREFIYRHGKKLHAFPKFQAPYPLAYDKEVFEMGLLDRALVYCTKGTVSFHEWKDSTPKRALDLGCGLGDWTIDAAKSWPECTFVGFDLVDVQINLDYVEPAVSRRIQWVHGNFLERLPFRDGEFDYVHLFSIAFAVPEDKWPSFFEEIDRILKPGGICESHEQDALFPVLPRWFTRPLHTAIKRSSSKNDGQAVPEKVYEPPADLPHDHACLEHLFESVFENRFINRTPTSILPGYFSAQFTKVISPPILYTPMPPLAPLPPFNRESVLVNRPRFIPPNPAPGSPTLPELSGNYPAQAASPTTPTQISGVGNTCVPFSGAIDSSQPPVAQASIDAPYDATSASQPSRSPTTPSLTSQLSQLFTPPPARTTPRGLKACTSSGPSEPQLPRGHASHPKKPPAITSSDIPPVPPLPSTCQISPLPRHSSKPSATAQTLVASQAPSHITTSTLKPLASWAAASPLSASRATPKPHDSSSHHPMASYQLSKTHTPSEALSSKSVVVSETANSASSIQRTHAESIPPVPPPMARVHSVPSSTSQLPSSMTPLHPSANHASATQQLSSRAASQPTPPPSWPQTTSQASGAPVSHPAGTPQVHSVLSASQTIRSDHCSASASVGSMTGSSNTHLSNSQVPTGPKPQRTDDLVSIASNDNKSSSRSSRDNSSLASSASLEKATVLISVAEEGETIQIGGDAAHGVIAIKALRELDEHILFLALYRAVGLVYAAKEAMRDELVDKVRRRDRRLLEYGWTEADFMSEERTRELFDAMWEQYTSDMRQRYALWHPAMQYGWPYPRQDPMTESEVADLEDLRRSILEARLLAREEDIQPTMRSVRLLIGEKSL